MIVFMIIFIQTSLLIRIHLLSVLILINFSFPQKPIKRIPTLLHLTQMLRSSIGILIVLLFFIKWGTNTQAILPIDYIRIDRPKFLSKMVSPRTMLIL